LKCKSAALLSLLTALLVLLVVDAPFWQNASGDYRTTKNACQHNIGAETNAGLYALSQTVTGDLVVENGTYLIEDMELHLTGKITARNDATVKVKNAKLVVTTRARDGIALLDRSNFIVENATLVLNSTNPGENWITVDNEAVVNITDSRLYGYAFIIGRQNSTTYVNNSSLTGPKPIDQKMFGVLTRDNSTARIMGAELDTVQASGHSSIYLTDSIAQTETVSVAGGGSALIEIENSHVGAAQWLSENCTLRISDSTAISIRFGGSVLHVEDSSISSVWVAGNSTTRLKSTSVNSVRAYDRSHVWLINSAVGKISTFDEGKVYVGWQVPLLGTISFPHTWIPILQGLAFLAGMSLVVALLIFLNRRWKRWMLKKAGL